MKSLRNMRWISLILFLVLVSCEEGKELQMIKNNSKILADYISSDSSFHDLMGNNSHFFYTKNLKKETIKREEFKFWGVFNDIDKLNLFRERLQSISKSPGLIVLRFYLEGNYYVSCKTAEPKCRGSYRR